MNWHIFHLVSPVTQREIRHPVARSGNGSSNTSDNRAQHKHSPPSLPEERAKYPPRPYHNDNYYSSLFDVSLQFWLTFFEPREPDYPVEFELVILHFAQMRRPNTRQGEIPADGIAFTFKKFANSAAKLRLHPALLVPVGRERTIAATRRPYFDQTTLRRITAQELREAIANGEVIEDYPNDKYGPSCLVLGFTSLGRPIHVQCSHPSRALIKIITAYQPDPNEWTDFKHRRISSGC